MSTMTTQTRLTAQQVADAWNAAHPVGTLVRYWRGLREGEPSGVGKVRWEARDVCGTASVWIEGCSGCIALSHVELASYDGQEDD